MWPEYAPHLKCVASPETSLLTPFLSQAFGLVDSSAGRQTREHSDQLSLLSVHNDVAAPQRR